MNFFQSLNDLFTAHHFTMSPFVAPIEGIKKGGRQAVKNYTLKRKTARKAQRAARKMNRN